MKKAGLVNQVWLSQDYRLWEKYQGTADWEVHKRGYELGFRYSKVVEEVEVLTEEPLDIPEGVDQEGLEDWLQAQGYEVVDLEEGLL